MLSDSLFFISVSSVPLAFYLAFKHYKKKQGIIGSIFKSTGLSFLFFITFAIVGSALQSNSLINSQNATVKQTATAIKADTSAKQKPEKEQEGWVTEGNLKSTTSKTEIDKILVSIPSHDKKMDYKNIAERLPMLGLTVKQIIIQKFDANEIKLSEGKYKKSDVSYMFSTNTPPVLYELCQASSIFYFIKRGKKWIPDDITANFLMNGYDFCIVH